MKSSIKEAQKTLHHKKKTKQNNAKQDTKITLLYKEIKKGTNQTVSIV